VRAVGASPAAAPPRPTDARRLSLADGAPAEAAVVALADALAGDPSTSYYVRPGFGSAYYAATLRSRLLAAPEGQRPLRWLNGAAALAYELPPGPPAERSAAAAFAAGLAAGRWSLAALAALRLDRLPEGAAAAEALERLQQRFCRRNGPCLYIAALGTRPEQQGRGAGGRLLRALAAEADEAGLPCYAEVGSRRAAALFERSDFSIAEILRPSPAAARAGLPEMLIMVRAPVAAADSGRGGAG